ncbi:MAG: phosphoadenylyl-sulfate reductase [Thermoplasmata archaeon]|nr:phosphoadenylyl-sulfate reductase [Thermoplasmata archaeon]
MSAVPKAESLADGAAEARRLSARWESLGAAEILREASARFAGKVAVGSAFGKEGLVVLWLLREQQLRLPVLFLDTGYHFPETLAYRDRIREALDLQVVSLTPVESVDEQDRRLGAALYRRDPDRCCRLRKVHPLQEALAGYDAWITGLRRDQSSHRASTPVVEWQSLGLARGVFKVNPLASWSRAAVDEFHAERGLPAHPLWDRGYRSIGCAPCTVPIREGAGERTGRWPGTGKSECGIHDPGLRAPEQQFVPVLAGPID